MVDHSHRGFDVIREQGFDIIKGENFIFENNTLNEGMLNAKHRKQQKGSGSPCNVPYAQVGQGNKY